MVLVDTSAWIEWLKDSPLAAGIAPHMKRLESILVPAVVQYELYRWALRERGEARALDAIGLTQQGQVVPLDTQLALRAAELAGDLKLAMADAIIYATARSRDVLLLTCDAHFEKLPAVEYISNATGAASRSRSGVKRR